LIPVFPQPVCADETDRPLHPVSRTPADRPASLRDISSIFLSLRRKIKLMDGPKDKHFSRRGAEAQGKKPTKLEA